jgi:hypothetical protein
MALMTPEELKDLQADIASTEALLDQAQAHYDAHKHLWTDEYCYHLQSDIDVKRFHLELTKLQVKLFSQL